MSSRSLLGAADVSDEHLAGMVADLLGLGSVDLLEVEVEPVAYDIPAITTAARHWVTGRAGTPDGPAPFRIFVKHIQSWERHPFFQQVPEGFRQVAAAGVPWRTEAEVYRSDLHGRLPEGLSMPRALDVVDLDELSAAVWIEDVSGPDPTWDLERYARAAYLLGRLAASRAVAPLADLRDVHWSLDVYARGRLEVQVVPMLMSEELWQHPLCAAFDDELKERLRSAARRAHDLAAEGDALPWLTSHGDACPNNLLAGDGDDLVMIDFGYWGAAPVGFDLQCLLVGDVQIGRRSAATLADVDEVIVPAYVEGLRDEGSAIPQDVVRRAHAIRTALMTGLSTVPFDLFEAPMTDETRRIAADRAVIARYSLDALEATST
jgi:Phosphotransferase enzyme family